MTLCRTCEELPVDRVGECSRCYQYRHRTGRPRPESVSLEYAARRASGRRMWRRDTCMELSSGVSTAQGGELSPEPCSVCGTIQAWVEGKPMPLCARHRGYYELAALILPDEDRLREAVTT